MILLALVPHVLAVAAYFVAPWLGRRLRPSRAVLMLSAVSCTLAVGTAATVAIVGYVGVGDLLPVGPRDWSASDLRHVLPVPPLFGALAVAVGAVLALRVATTLTRSAMSHRRMLRLLEHLPKASGLTVLEADTPIAYAVPCRGGGRVVVSTGLLRCLSTPQRRALLAHERAHLDLRHPWHSQLARVCAAANPLLVPLAAAVDRAIERRADLEAVDAVGDPRVVAEAVGVAALSAHSAPRLALAAGRSDVAERVRLLLSPSDDPKHVTGGVPGCVITLCWSSVLLVAGYVYGLIETIEATAR